MNNLTEQTRRGMLCTVICYDYDKTLLHLLHIKYVYLTRRVGDVSWFQNCQFFTSIVHCELDYCNSLYCNIPNSQL